VYSCGFLRMSADFGSYSNRPLWATFQSFLAIPSSDFTPSL